MSDFLTALFRLGPQLADHVILSASAIALGIIVALPLAVWASRSATVARFALGFASLVQTIPALALLALFFPVLLALRSVFGESLPTLGFLPALLALALYALLPILRNAVTARANMDAGALQAADAMGMSFAQKLWLVEAPLAAPFIMAGIRTAAVWTIGAATLATTIGQPSLGDPIFAGLQTQNWSLVLAGCLASAALALTADALFGLVERGFAQRRPVLAWAGGLVALAGIALAGFSGSDFARDSSREVVVVGAKNFSEQFILARLIGSRLERAGYDVEYRGGLGSAVIHGALTSGDIDVYVDYSGTIWANQLSREDQLSRADMIAEIARWEDQQSGTLLLGPLGFENAYAFAVTRETASRLSLVTLADLGPVSPQLVMGGDVEFFERPEWTKVRDAYGLNFTQMRNFTATFMYDALSSSEADVISAFSSDGRIAADDLVVLQDPREALPAYDALLLVSPDRSGDEVFLSALRPLLGTIDVETMRAANYSVDRSDNKQNPREAAQWLAEAIGL